MPTPTPDDILTITQGLEAEWPALCSAEWQNMETHYRRLCSQLETATGPAQMRVAADLIQLFEPHPVAYARLLKALAVHSTDSALLLHLCDLAAQLGLTEVAANFKAAAQPRGQQRFIHQNNPSEATSIKLGNVKLAFDNLSTLGVFILTTISKEIVQQAAGILQAAGVLAVLAMLYKAAAVKLAEREATVFWGFARAPRQEDGSVKEDVILTHANTERQTIGLAALSQEELRQSLHELEKLNSVQRISNKDGSWRIIEKHDVKST